jgi:hypothetical protein
MKIIAGWVVALAMIVGTGTAIALNVKSQPTLTEEACVGLSCWPENPAIKHRPAQRTTVTSPSESGKVVEQPELSSQARVDRSRKADRITVVVPATEAVLPPECEPPFSPLAKLPSSNFSARCLT